MILARFRDTVRARSRSWFRVRAKAKFSFRVIVG
jgi:hypothetical protein